MGSTAALLLCHCCSLTSGEGSWRRWQPGGQDWLQTGGFPFSLSLCLGPMLGAKRLLGWGVTPWWIAGGPPGMVPVLVLATCLLILMDVGGKLRCSEVLG